MIGYTILSAIKAAQMASFHGWRVLFALPSISQQLDLEINYFANPEIMNGFAAWSQLYANLYESKKERVHTKAEELISSIINNHDGVLLERSRS